MRATGSKLLSVVQPKNRRHRFNPSFSFPLPFVGVPASLGPGLRTASGAESGLGAKLLGAIAALTG